MTLVQEVQWVYSQVVNRSHGRRLDHQLLKRHWTSVCSRCLDQTWELPAISCVRLFYRDNNRTRMKYTQKHCWKHNKMSRPRLVHPDDSVGYLNTWSWDFKERKWSHATVFKSINQSASGIMKSLTWFKSNPAYRPKKCHFIRRTYNTGHSRTHD